MKKILLPLTLLTLISCAPKNAEVVETKKSEPVVPAGEAAEGLVLFETNCGKCHELPVVGRYSKEKWQKIVPAMAKEAQLDAAQESKIAAYVNWKLQQQ
jgi:mono/diheme cytochrome c family protein